jgi:hypothetical protein
VSQSIYERFERKARREEAGASFLGAVLPWMAVLSLPFLRGTTVRKGRVKKVRNSLTPALFYV